MEGVQKNNGVMSKAGIWSESRKKKAHLNQLVTTGGGLPGKSKAVKP